MKSELLKQKFDLFLKVQDSINAVESRYTTVFVALAAGAGTFAAFDKLGQSSSGTELSFFYWVIPYLVVIGFYWFSMIARRAALLCGYLEALEEELNKDFNQNILIWNSQFTNKFFIPKKFGTNALSLWVFLIPLVAVIIFCFYKVFNIYHNLMWLVISEMIFCIVFGSVFARDLATNDKARAEAKKYALAQFEIQNYQI